MRHLNHRVSLWHTLNQAEAEARAMSKTNLDALKVHDGGLSDPHGVGQFHWTKGELRLPQPTLATGTFFDLVGLQGYLITQ